MFGVHIWEICNFISLIWEVWSLELRELILKMENVDISGVVTQKYENCGLGLTSLKLGTPKILGERFRVSSNHGNNRSKLSACRAT